MVKLLNYRLFNYIYNLKSLTVMKKSTFKGHSKLKFGKSVSKLSNIHVKPSYKVLDKPTKSLNDKKQYKVIQLENGLTACLISDPIFDDDSDSCDGTDSSETTDNSDNEENNVSDTDTDGSKSSETVEKERKLAAAALCIGVGSMSDPKEIPGLAHFLEHMVFMGSEKFPQENDFDSFVNKHGGSDNGSTDYEVTTFYFDCFERHLHTALDKFSQFFISPLMKRDSMTREREAVESEFQMAVPSEEFRKEQLLVSLSRDCSPVNSFSWGNLITLKENVTDDRLYEMLHEFRKRHYTAHRMTVAVQARLPIDTLESYVVKYFSGVPSNNLPPCDFTTCENVFDTPEFRMLYYVKPVKDICQVDLTFCLPSLIHMYRTKPHTYVSWLLGYQGKNGLYSYLKKKVWALSVTAGNEESGAEYNSMYATFTISLVLTKEGLSNLKEVIEKVFSFIDLLKESGPVKRIFTEIQTIEATSFRFEDEESAADNVEDIAENMQFFPPKDYLTGESLMFEYDPSGITMVMDNLVPDKMNIMVSTSEVPPGIVHDQVEPWFKTEYKAIEIPPDWLECWKNAKGIPEFALPHPNPFLTTDFTILPKNKKSPKYPEKIMDTEIIELWYRKDDKFETPMAYYFYHLISPLSLQSAESHCMMEMYAIFVYMNLAEEGYDAQLTELMYSILAVERGISIIISGYNQKLHLLVELVGKYLNNVTELLSEELFEAVREKVVKSYYNGLIKPSRLCKDLRLTILQKNYFSLLQKYNTINKITYAQMKEFSNNFLKNLYIQGLVQGNISSSTAIDATNSLLSNINTAALAEHDQPQIDINEIPNGEHCCRVTSFSKDNPNSVITNYYQCGTTDIRNSVMLELIMLLIEEPIFDTLRTKEQLGYKVDCSVRDTYGVLGYAVTVHTQVNKFTTNHVDSRIEDFLWKSHKTIKHLSKKKFQRTKKDLIKMKQCGDTDLEDECYKHWEEILNCKYQFNRESLEIKEIEGLSIKEVKQFWEKNNLGSKGRTHKKLSFQIVGVQKDISHDKVTEDTQSIKSENVGKIRHIFSNKSPKVNSSKDDYRIVIGNINELQYLNNQEEITSLRTSSYFIENIDNFKNMLQSFKKKEDNVN